MAKRESQAMAVAPRPEAAAPAPAPPPVENNRLKALLEKQLGNLQDALPRHMTAERLAQVVGTLVYRTPKLQECDPLSILASVKQAASLGLDLAPNMMEAYLIPRWNKNTKSNECTFQPGYRGLLKLALQSGEIASVRTALVREGDAFLCRWTPDLEFLHEPVHGARGGAITHVYSYAKLKNGERLVEVMDADEIEAFHQRSEGYRTAQAKGWAETGPWVTDWPEMARKTVLKRHCKSLPRSLELAAAIEADDEPYRRAEAIDVTPRPGALPGRGAAGLAGRLGAPPAPEPEPEFEAGEGVARPVYSEDEGGDPAGGEAEAFDRAEGT
jgi:recombination protein RecT